MLSFVGSIVGVPSSSEEQLPSRRIVAHSVSNSLPGRRNIRVEWNIVV